mgnify:CR=1 FL=1
MPRGASPGEQRQRLLEIAARDEAALEKAKELGKERVRRQRQRAAAKLKMVADANAAKATDLLGEHASRRLSMLPPVQINEGNLRRLSQSLYHFGDSEINRKRWKEAEGKVIEQAAHKVRSISELLEAESERLAAESRVCRSQRT